MTRRQWIVFNVKIWGSLVLYALVGLFSVCAWIRWLLSNPDSWAVVVVGPVLMFLVFWVQKGQEAYVDAVAAEAIKQIRETE